MGLVGGHPGRQQRVSWPLLKACGHSACGHTSVSVCAEDKPWIPQADEVSFEFPLSGWGTPHGAEAVTWL